MPADKIYRRQLIATPYVLFAKVSIILFMCKFLRIFHSFSCTNLAVSCKMLIFAFKNIKNYNTYNKKK